MSLEVYCSFVFRRRPKGLFALVYFSVRRSDVDKLIGKKREACITEEMLYCLDRHHTFDNTPSIQVLRR